MGVTEYIWFFVHNCVAHPILITRTDMAERFHDWTARRMAKAGGRMSDKEE